MSSALLRAPAMEVWAGPECTVNRVGDEYFNQLERTGHNSRIDDLELFAELGVAAIRYPVLWERTAPRGAASADWSWADERLGRLCGLGLRPIVGLVHHGSGPPWTSLLDDAFAPGLAEYAGAVAARYPWVDDWTPVNEPLTTARFSALYGHWYPHARDDRSFVQALLNQCRATVLAMEAVRRINPSARLVQTDDLGKTHSTPFLAYQAEYENERRWVTFDLLCGRVGPGHAMWQWFETIGVEPAELEWFLEHPCPPDVIGVNHYLSGERFLDERLERYPADSHGTNGRHQYADVLAARVLRDGPLGPERLLREAWERYGIPLAVTEAHNGCTREEQLRWLDEIWCAGHALRADGVDVRAVTVWSLLGADGWSSLCRDGGRAYEPGVFDVRSPSPRPTALAAMTRGLAADGRWDHPVLDSRGWWRRPERLLYPPAVDGGPPRRFVARRRLPRRLLVTGATGTLGQAFARACEARGLPYRLVARRELDIADPASVASALGASRPWAVVNAAGYVRVDDAENEPERCFRENHQGPAALAAACSAQGAPLVTFSSDLVFSGDKDEPYVESDAVAALNVYGRSKAAAEASVLAAAPDALVVRTSAFFGPRDRWNFVTLTLEKLAAGEPVVADGESVVSPTYVPELVDVTLDLLIDGERGVWHLANAGAVTWAGLARLAAGAAGVEASLVHDVPAAHLALIAPRPAYSALGSERGILLQPLDAALERYARER